MSAEGEHHEAVPKPTPGQSLTGEVYKLPSEGYRVLSPLVDHNNRLS